MVKEGRVVVSSRDVAQVFGKQHQHVLRDIDAKIAQRPDLDGQAFQEVSLSHPMIPGTTLRSFEMNRKGFTLLAMRYTGPKALQFQIAYIDRFDAMEVELQGRQVPTLPAPSPVAPGLTHADVERIVDAKLTRMLSGALGFVGAPTPVPQLPRPMPVPEVLEVALEMN